MNAMVSQITSPTIVYSTVYLGTGQKKTSKLRVTGLCEGNSPVTSEFPAQSASNENVSIWWRHHVIKQKRCAYLWNILHLLVYNLTYLPGTNLSNLLSGEPDYFGRNKILSGYDLSHYQVPHCIRVFFYFVWFVFIHHNFQFYFKLCTYCNILDINLS